MSNDVVGKFLTAILLMIFLVAAPFLSLDRAALADINSCTANVTPHSVQPNSQTNFTFTVANNGPGTVVWIQIQRPSPNFTVSNSVGWSGSASTGDDSAILYDGDQINSGGQDSVVIAAHAGENQTPADNWNVQLSDNPDGSNATTCSGNLGTAVSGQRVPDPDFTPPAISNLSASNLTSNSIQIGWTTDEPATSQIFYGQDDSYGQNSPLDSSLITSHTVKLTGLAPNTSYHYMVATADSAGNETDSADNTFLTAIPEQSSGSAQTPAIGVKITNPGDKIPPAISLTSKIPNVVQSSLNINGTATDNSAVVKVEYSTDGGKDWLSAEKTAGLNTKSASFTISPPNLDDGNYSFIARTIDGGGNITATPALKLVVDRQPPIIGGAVFSLGPQLLQPESNGAIDVLPGVDERITLSAVGGPTSITLNSQATGSKTSSLFSLAQLPDSGLWSGIVAFDRPGQYTLTANSVDGAGNKTAKVLSTVRVLDYSSVTGDHNQPLKAYLTVYRFSVDSNNWEVWGGSPYNQANPQRADQNGHFSYFLPAGRYYVKASASGYSSLITKIIALDNPSPLDINLMLVKSGFKLSNLTAGLRAADVANKTVSAETTSLSSLKGHPAPDFALTAASGQVVHLINLLGKPTDLIFLNTWSPSSASQLVAVQTLASNRNVNVQPVAVQQGAAELQAYDAIAGYNLGWLSDPTGLTAVAYKSSFVPAHYFLDRDGVVRKIVTGNLSRSEILNDLSSL